MITNFKIFESIEDIKLKHHSCWTIFGSQPHCFEIIKKLKAQLKNEYDINRVLTTLKEDINDYSIPEYIGTNLFYDTEHFSYHSYEKESERRKFFEKYEFKGEMKEVDGKIVVDTLEVYTNKYNL